MNFSPLFRLLGQLDARSRMLICIAVSGLISVLMPSWLRLPTRIIIAWNSGAVCFLVLAYSMMATATTQKIRRKAQRQDEGLVAISILLIAAACVSLLAIVFMLKNGKDLSATIVTLHVTLAGMTVVCSWLLIHTVFALHYAHHYYQDDSKTPQEDLIGGLDFPGRNQPDYWDFLYFSFVIGMTCQVSDVQVASPSMRRLALVHGVLTFFFNTVILALSINIIAGLV